MSPLVKAKINFFYLFSMIALLFVHNYNYSPFIITPSTCVTGTFSATELIELLFSNSLFRFRMGLLMAISGYLMAYSKSNSYKELVIKKTKTLLIPYVLISIIGLLVTFAFENGVFGWHNTNTTGMIGKSLWHFTLQDYFHYLFVAPVSFQLWYLKTIFIMALLSPVIEYILDKVPFEAFVITFVLWMFTNYLDGETRDRAFIFYGIGYYLRLTDKDVLTPFPWFSPALAMFIFICISFLRTYISFSPISQVYNLKYMLTMLFKLDELIGLYAVWFFFDHYVKIIIHNKWYLRYSTCSFFLYAFHAPFINYISQILRWNGFYELPYSHFIGYIVLPTFVLPIMLALNNVVKASFPTVFKVLTGGRSANTSYVPKITTYTSQPAISPML